MGENPLALQTIFQSHQRAVITPVQNYNLDSVCVFSNPHIRPD